MWKFSKLNDKCHLKIEIFFQTASHSFSFLKTIQPLLLCLPLIVFSTGCKEETAAQTVTSQQLKTTQLDSKLIKQRNNSSNSLSGKNDFVCNSSTDPVNPSFLSFLNSPSQQTNPPEIKVGISDTGVQTNHIDLKNNLLADSHVDFLSESKDPNPDPEYGGAEGDHGTNVAGIIGAESCNEQGSRGVAPNAKLAVLNLLAPKVLNHKDFNLFFLKEPTYPFNIMNQSWSHGSSLSYWFSEFSEYVANVTTATRDHNRIFVKAAGNFYPRDSGYDPEHRHPYMILVGAINQRGYVASYSSAGANLWVVAPSAEANETGIYTTEFNSTYRNNFNGTSAATPMVSGVVALMLQRNPNLTWRVVKHILANTATQVDSKDTGWVTNKANYHFSRDYGFGLVNAALAVDWATREFSLGEFKKPLLGNKNELASIPDSPTDMTTQEIDTTTNLTIEAIELTLDIDHPFPSDLKISLTSPSGTEAIVLEPHPDFNTTLPNMKNIRLIINHFYGESTLGKWTLKISDFWKEDSGTLNSWKLTAFGH